jgi:pyruvate dehydrogenase E2 component (dihydrolipoamide acetyltransferase)
MSSITPIVMPKWGLEMREGTVTAWLVEEGARIAVGQPIVDVETDKISNTYEAGDAGLLRRRVAQEGDTLPVKGLLAVLADASVSDEQIDAFIAGYVVPAAAEGEEEGDSAYSTLEVDGITVRYARRGPERGAPVLFLHGFGGDLNNWLFNLDAIAEAAPVIALDLPGHGQSSAKLPGDGSLKALARFVVQVLDALDIERVHVVGHSMGAAIGARMALDHRARVASLALINAAGLGPEINTAYTEGFTAAESRRELKPVVEQLFADPALVTRQLLDDLLRYKRIDGVSQVLAALGGALFADGRQREQPGRDLAATGVPVLVIWGRDDRIIPSSHATHALPGATVQVLEGAGHMAMMEKAKEVNALIGKHIAGR